MNQTLTRGEVHVLLCGDPATARSTIHQTPVTTTESDNSEELSDATVDADAILNELA